jgi:putative FmdB family regulatory protein
MLYTYTCDKCEHDFDLDFKMGHAPKAAPCPDCNTECRRVFRSMQFILSGEGWPGKSMSFGNEMTDRNKKAGERMRKNRVAPKMIAHDFGGGDVREIAPTKNKRNKTS